MSSEQNKENFEPRPATNSRAATGIPISSEDNKQSFTVTAPSISLPKGGGAIRGIGEKFAANPVTGTGSMSVPIATSQGRAGFGPQLSLAYDSGTGNGIFGIGWSLSLPAITRKTDKGLPKYQDVIESDLFILSGAEDLVRTLEQQNPDPWAPEVVPDDTYQIVRFRPRVEGLFARIERWTNKTYPEDCFWRSVTKDNVTTFYGKTSEARIADPFDPRHIFSWLICESFDDKGNAMLYRYVEEDDAGLDLTQVNEANRTKETRSANRYLKRIQYCNHTPHIKGEDLADRPKEDWLMEVVFDYGEHDTLTPTTEAAPEAATEAAPKKAWAIRSDPFSTYRAGFEVRTYRQCQHILMFHRFAELGDEPTLIRSTDFTYSDEADANNSLNPIYTFLLSIEQKGYAKKTDGNGSGYLNRTLPALEFTYSAVDIDETVQVVDEMSITNLPYGADGTNYQWVDLDSEGLPGILTEQANSWFYKRNISNLPINDDCLKARFDALEVVAAKPSPTSLHAGQQFMDLRGDGQLYLVQLSPPLAGFFERDTEGQWLPFRPFAYTPNVDWSNPNLKSIDLDGDGHADILISEDQVFTWYRSRAEEGFEPAQSVLRPFDEDKGPALVFADSTQSIFLADLSGDGLTDIVRIRNSEICYWPNLGYGRFGAKVTMDNAPVFDHSDQFDQRRIRLADIDGSGTTDIIYLGRTHISLYFNRSGNSWSSPRQLTHFPTTDNLSTVTVIDLLGNGTACLVWSSPLPDAMRQPMRYIDLMGGQKPHLLIGTVNNLGAETKVHYMASTRFYLQDRAAGRPWITKLPFPVYVIERLESFDHISKSKFVSQYTYHHGYFDGIEREFRGFGMVEQLDTQSFANFSAEQVSNTLPANGDPEFHQPPILTKTWFHNGAYLRQGKISRLFEHEYYKGDQAHWLLPDTILPAGLTAKEEREACRALKGRLLRQEIYCEDGTIESQHPFSVTEHTYHVRQLQPSEQNRFGVFFARDSEALSYHYERHPNDPRITHAMTLEVDEFGNVTKSASIGYPRRPNPDRKPEQALPQITYTENQVTNKPQERDWYRIGVPVETRTYELTAIPHSDGNKPFTLDDLLKAAANAVEIAYEVKPDNETLQKRLIERVRSLYCRNDLSGALPPGDIESLALPYESYKVAFTPGLLTQVFADKLSSAELGQILGNEAQYRNLDQDGIWWMPSGRVFFSPDPNVPEASFASDHFFLPQGALDPFGNPTKVTYDNYNLLITRTEDALKNLMTAQNDYRVLQPKLVSDANSNRTAVAFDALGMVVGTALMGKETETIGDSLGGFIANLEDETLQAHMQNPFLNAHDILKNATTRLVYDLFAYLRSKGDAQPQPPVVYTMDRETHTSDLSVGEVTRIQHSFSFSDGFGREIQKKLQAEAGVVPKSDDNGRIIIVNGQPEMTHSIVNPRWVGSGWIIFNNKGKPVRQFEPFFTDTHRFEFNVRIGVSPTLFYDPMERVVATLHPNHTWEKVVFNPWRQETWDVNDTVMLDPRTDEDVQGFFRALPEFEYLPTWYQQRKDGDFGATPTQRRTEQQAALQAARHAGTPTIAEFDTLGRTFLTTTHNKFERQQNSNTPAIIEEKYSTRVVIDIEGNQREVVDAKDRIVMRYDYDLLGNRIHQASMEAGERWMLSDVMGKPLRAWDSRQYAFHTEYDALRRPLKSFVQGGDASDPNARVIAPEILVENTVYGESNETGLGEAEQQQANLRGRVYQHFDSAGIVTNYNYDFKGNLLQNSRQFVSDYKNATDWRQNPMLEEDVFLSSTTYDALNRIAIATTPDMSIYKPLFNEANLLDKVEVNLLGEQEDDEFIWTPFVTNVDYNAKGQRTLIQYANGARTNYEYEFTTFRLTNLRTVRVTNPPEDTGNLMNDLASIFGMKAENEPPNQLFQDNNTVQDLHYTYDPIGNITQIADNALPTIFHANQQVEPNSRYTYDATYRLIEATGREHVSQSSFQYNGSNSRDYPFTGVVQINDLQAVRNYTERYEYDSVGNFERMIHQAVNGSWVRAYTYNENSLTNPAQTSNRLSSTTLHPNGNQPIVEVYTHDAHGNITTMPHLPLMQWNFKDQLSATARQVVNNGTPETTYYVYDASGQRVRKVTETPSGRRKHERFYLGSFEMYREYESDGETIVLQRESLHVMDDKQRIALVETRTQGYDGSLAQLQRYQLGNHLGSASLELDEESALISYEEYHPYGTTAFQSGRSAAEVSLKRYRYTGKERDEESGFSYHGARYYAPWMGRWITSDPIGLKDGINVYAYVRGNPVTTVDGEGTSGELGPFTTVDTEGIYGKLTPISADSVTTTTHEDIKTEAAKYTASKMFFGYTDIAKWQTDPAYLMSFKENFVFENREIIKAAAAKFDLPAEMIAGVAFNEIGGKDPLKPTVYTIRKWVPGTADKDTTSLGQQAIQIRRAAESLGYDAKKLTDAQRESIVNSLNDPSQSIFIAAKHLSDLRNIDNLGKAGKDLSQDDIKVIGARYNQGPEKSQNEIKKDLSYGQAITKRWDVLGNLLKTAPAALDYSPVKNNIIKPIQDKIGAAAAQGRQIVQAIGETLDGAVKSLQKVNHAY